MKSPLRLIIALLFVTAFQSQTLGIVPANAECRSYEECPNDPNSGFTSPAQAAATSAASAAQIEANRPEPGPISPLAASIPDVPLGTTAEEQAKIYAEAKAKTDAQQASLPKDSCERFENYNSQSCVAVRTEAARLESEARQIAEDKMQKLIDSQLPADSCEASQNRFLQSCTEKKAQLAALDNEAINVLKLKAGYLFSSVGEKFTPSSTVTIVLSAKGVKTKTISAQVSATGQLLIPSKINLSGYQVQIKSGQDLISKIKIPTAKAPKK